MLEEGAPEGAILSIAGHVSKEMMEHYSHIRIEAKREAIKTLTLIVQEDGRTSEGEACEPRGRIAICVEMCVEMCVELARCFDVCCS
jgi:hypothetical protein